MSDSDSPPPDTPLHADDEEHVRDDAPNVNIGHDGADNDDDKEDDMFGGDDDEEEEEEDNVV